MDMKKAFDTVKHGVLFRKLIKRNIPHIFIRLLIFMYKGQTAQVKWKGKLSDQFSMTNGVKQGAVLSAILFCVYIDDMMKDLRKKRDGCWINGAFTGIIAYADDIVLMSPSIDGLQLMIDNCLAYAKNHNLTFSTHENPHKSKTKCISFRKNNRSLPSLTLDEKKLPWVKSVKHLGTTILDDTNSRMSQDCLEKRAQYIARNNKLYQEFYYATQSTRVFLNNVFNTSFYGAPLWDLFSPSVNKLESSWNVSQRIMNNLPKNTHRYLIEPISNTHHIIKSLHKRFINFIGNIRLCTKPVLRSALQVTSRDVRSIPGKNLRMMMLQTLNYDLNDYDPYSRPYREVPATERWRLELLKDVLQTSIDTGLLSEQEHDTLLSYVCGS